MNNKTQRAPTYTKRDIVRRIAGSRKENMIVAAEWVNEVFDTLRDILMKADPRVRIEIRDFGVLEVKPTKSKPRARNPKSGEIILVPAHRKTHFKPGKLLKNVLSRPLNGDESPAHR